VVSSPYLTPMGKCADSPWKDQFKNFSTLAGCPGDIDCLRGASSDLLRNLSHQFDSISLPGHVSAYEPCIEGEGGYLVHNTAEVIYNGQTQGFYFMGGNNVHDGQTFVPSSLNSNTTSPNASLLTYLTTSFPFSAGDPELDQVLDLYPLEEFSNNLLRGAQIFQDVIFGCAVDWMATGLQDAAWRWLFAVPPAVHAVDNAYEFPYFYSNAPPSPSMMQSFIGPIVSLISSDPPSPNTINNRPQGDPDWPLWLTATGNQYKVMNLTIGTMGNGNVSDSYISSGSDAIGSQSRCDFWAGVRIRGGW